MTAKKHLLSEKDFNKYLKKLEKINDKIKKVEDIIFKTDETGNTYMLNTHSGKYLFMKLQPLYKERELLSNKLYPEKKNDDDNINDDGNIYDNIDDDDNIYDNIDDVENYLS